MVKDEEDLLSAVTRLLKDNSLALRLSDNAGSIIAKNQGATVRNSLVLKAIGLANGN
jgi:hypothetical protein